VSRSSIQSDTGSICAVGESDQGAGLGAGLAGTDPVDELRGRDDAAVRSGETVVELGGGNRGITGLAVLDELQLAVPDRLDQGSNLPDLGQGRIGVPGGAGGLFSG